MPSNPCHPAVVISAPIYLCCKHFCVLAYILPGVQGYFCLVNYICGLISMTPTVHSTANGAPCLFHIPVYFPFLELFFLLPVSFFPVVTDSTCHSLANIFVNVNDPVASFGITRKYCVYWSSAVTLRCFCFFVITFLCLT